MNNYLLKHFKAMNNYLLKHFKAMKFLMLLRMNLLSSKFYCYALVQLGFL